MNRSELGRLGEDFAAGLLQAEGYRILERNFRCNLGEVDIIAEKDGEIAFVEVKTRRSVRFGYPSEAVTREKQRRIRRSAEYYMQNHVNGAKQVDFQVVEVFCSQITGAF